jgi:hypothetical protein
MSATYQIVVLGQTPADASGNYSVAGVFYVPGPANAQVPLPNFVSRDPNIDAATFAACQSGASVETPFTAGAYPSTFTQAQVEAAIVTLYGAAALSNPAQALVGQRYDGSAWSQVTQPSFFLRGASPSLDFWAAASAGLLKGVTVSRAVGKVATSSTSNQAVMATTYTAPGSNGQRSFVSSNANDTLAGTGAQKLTLTYLTAAFALKSEVISLNGATPVNTTNTDIAYVENFGTSQMGSGGINAGIITMTTGTNGTGTTIGTIAVGDISTRWCHHYIPAGTTCMIKEFSAGATAGIGAVANLIQVPSVSVAGAPTDQIGEPIVHAGATVRFEYDPAVVFAGPNLIYLNVQPSASTASTTYGSFRYAQFGT